MSKVISGHSFVGSDQFEFYLPCQIYLTIHVYALLEKYLKLETKQFNWVEFDYIWRKLVKPLI
jgi:hypothetical protein